MEKDGIHWNAEANRDFTDILLTFLARGWDPELFLGAPASAKYQYLQAQMAHEHHLRRLSSPRPPPRPRPYQYNMFEGHIIQPWDGVDRSLHSDFGSYHASPGPPRRPVPGPS